MKKIGIYCFSNTSYFFKELVLEGIEDFEFYAIVQRHQQKKLFDDILDKKNILYLYEKFNQSYSLNDDTNINFQFNNIYKILESDKDGYRNIDKDKQLILVKNIYSIYKKYLLEKKIDYMLFPDIETVDGNILINLCYELNIEPIYYVHTRYLGKSFFSSTVIENLPKYYGKFTNNDVKLAKNFLTDFKMKRINSSNLLKTWTDYESKKIVVSNVFKRAITSFKYKLGLEKNYFGEDNFFQKMRTNIVPILEIYRKFMFSYQKKYFDIFDDKDINKLPNNFILFALQVTPESSINTLEQYFTEQEKAIDLVRLNMPSSFYIIVKEHPMMLGIRKTSWYRKIRKKAGIILVSSEVNTNKLVDRAALICTVTGTIALECYLKDKPALMFGSTFFSHLVHNYDSYKNFRLYLNDIIFNHIPTTEEEKIEELAKIYNISYSTIIDDPLRKEVVMEKGNVKNCLDAIKEHIIRIEKYNEENKI
ncbi:capsular biosynthesis protein [Arcobacter sp. KX21116]|uniref:capsular polysaccharide export protein, LipB/KpsS family n=1 Tax=Arcobacter iocasae TaxID=2906515 RepID=UPI0035D4B670